MIYIFSNYTNIATSVCYSNKYLLFRHQFTFQITKQKVKVLIIKLKFLAIIYQF